MTELHNDGQDRAQRAAMQPTSRYLQTSPEDEASQALTICRRRLQDCRDRAYAQRRDGVFEAIDDLIAELDKPEKDFDAAVKGAHEAEGSDFTTSDMQEEHGLGHAQLGLSRGRRF